MNEQTVGTKEKHCRDCDFCVVKLKIPNKTGRDLAESPISVFDNIRVEEISCSLGMWVDNRTFSSMAVFDASDFGKIAAEHCGFYSDDEEES